MRCFKCGKIIPETSLVCPYCYASIERDENGRVIEQNNGNLATVNLNFESSVTDNSTIDSSEENKKFNLHDFITDKSNRKKVIILGSSILGIFILLIIIIAILAGASKPKYYLFTKTATNLFEYLDDNIIGSNAKNSGNYKLVYNLNGTSKEFRGDYAVDLYNRLIDINGYLRDPNEDTGGVVITDENFDFDFYMKNNNIYFKSSELFDGYILFPYEDPTGILSTNKYDMGSLITGVEDAFISSLKASTYTTEKNVTIDYRGTDTQVNRKYIKLDNAGKKKFLDTFYSTLLDDSSFISEYSKISGYSKTDVERILNNYMTTADYTYSASDGNISYLSVYYKGNKVYRLDLDMNESSNYEIILDIGETKYYLTYKENDDEVFYGELGITESTLNDVVTKDYTYNLKYKDTSLNGTLELVKDTNPVVKASAIDAATSIRSFTADNYATLKTNLNKYMSNTTWVDSLSTIFATRCTKDLNCTCENNADNCTCTFNGSIISCPKENVQ